MAVKEITIAAKGANSPESWLETEEAIITAVLKIIEKIQRDFFIFGFSKFLNIASEIPNCKRISKIKRMIFLGWEKPTKAIEITARADVLNLFGVTLKIKSANGRKI